MAKVSEFSFHWRHNCFEIRTNYKPDSRELSISLPVELVKYGPDGHCFTLAHFRETRDGYDLVFIGKRPFTHIESSEIHTIWTQLSAAHTMLDAYFKARTALDCEDDD